MNIDTPLWTTTFSPSVINFFCHPVARVASSWLQIIVVLFSAFTNI